MKRLTDKKGREILPNVRRKREATLVEELQRDHGYTFMEIARRDERTSMMFDRKTNVMSGAVVVKLAVPLDSALGAGFTLARRKKDAKEKAASKPTRKAKT